MLEHGFGGHTIMVERNAKINELVYLRDAGAIQLEVTVCRCVENSTFGWAPSVSEVYGVGVSQLEHQLDFCGGSHNGHIVSKEQGVDWCHEWANSWRGKMCCSTQNLWERIDIDRV
jgi:hypothetical protein